MWAKVLNDWSSEPEKSLLHLWLDGFPFNAQMLFASSFESEPVRFSRLELCHIPPDYSVTHWSLFMMS